MPILCSLNDMTCMALCDGNFLLYEFVKPVNVTLMPTNLNSTSSIICPVCGGENAGDAVFCGNPTCHKALGEFRYALEELQQEARWHEALADRVSGFIGKPHFLVAHAVWFVVWIVLNAGVIALVHRFDEYPYSLLGIILSIEAIFITGFLLISQNRQSAHADKRAELDYEVNVRTYRKIQEIDEALTVILDRLNQIEAPTRPENESSS